MRCRAVFLAALAVTAFPAAALAAEAVVATRLIRAGEVVAAEDLATVAADIPGAMADPTLAVGLEARVAIYPGRPVRAADLGSPALVERNQIVPLSFERGGLSILTEGRALARGGAGDTIRVTNLSSRTTVSGLIGPDGRVRVLP